MRLVPNDIYRVDHLEGEAMITSPRATLYLYFQLSFEVFYLNIDCSPFCIYMMYIFYVSLCILVTKFDFKK